MERAGWPMCLLALAAIGGVARSAAEPKATPFYALSFERRPTVRELSELGRRLFFEPALSASGRTACASCHDPKHAYAAPNAAAVQRAGADGQRPGVRAVPTLKYAQTLPPFTAHFIDDEGDDSIDQGPAGGRTWDGRAQSAHAQAQLPLLSEFEMANRDPQAVVAALEGSGLAPEFRRVFGARIFAERALAFRGLLLALETFQQEPAEFYPYSSKYDAYLRGAASLSAEERAGLAVFNDPQRGNCARCHPSARRAGALPQFTDYGYAALGVPRNAAIPANGDARYFDLGLCGPWRTDLQDHPEYCGLFRTPTLRNVATRAVFFHNGALKSLDDAVRFYATRDSDPGKWYPRAGVGVLKFDDLPQAFVENLDALSPFDKERGAKAKMSEEEVAQVVAFLHALTDGYAQSP